MKNRLEKLKADLLDLADFVQESAYEDYRSLSPDRITQMLELSKQLATVAGKLDTETSSAINSVDAPKRVRPFPRSRQSRSIH